MIKIWLCFEQQTWKYFALGHDAQTTQPSVCRHDLMPNIFLSGPPTQSIATYHHSDETLNHLQKYFEVWLNPFISHQNIMC